jgi:hypothetical protein
VESQLLSHYFFLDFTQIICWMGEGGLKENRSRLLRRTGLPLHSLKSARIGKCLPATQRKEREKVSLGSSKAISYAGTISVIFVNISSKMHCFYEEKLLFVPAKKESLELKRFTAL